MNQKSLFALSIVACILFCSSIVTADLADDVGAISYEIWRYVDSSPLDKIIVLGADRSDEENEALSIIQNTYPEIAQYQVIDEKDVTKEIEENHLILILGGPRHSPYADSLFVASRDLITSSRNLDNGELRYIWHGSPLTHIIFSDKDGFAEKTPDPQPEYDISPNLPGTIPIHPDGTASNIREAYNDETRKLFITFSLDVDASVPEVNDWYAKALSENGWVIKSDQTIAGYRLIQSDNDNLYVSMQAASDDQGATISQTVSIEGPPPATITPPTNTISTEPPSHERRSTLRRATARSPLSAVLPPALVPITATGIGVALLWFWKELSALANKIGRRILASKIMKEVKKRDLIPHYKGFDIFNVRIKYREWAAIAASAIIFALSLSFAYFVQSSFFLFILLNIFVNLIIYTITNFTRLYLDKHFNLHREYHIWWWGAFVTIVTGWFGNTFSLAGYVVSDGKDAKHKGEVNFIQSCVIFAVSLFFIFWYFMAPGCIIEMCMILSLSITFINLMPFEPFNGKEIIKWNKKTYFMIFIPALLLYIFLTSLV